MSGQIAKPSPAGSRAFSDEKVWLLEEQWRPGNDNVLRDGAWRATLKDAFYNGSEPALDSRGMAPASRRTAPQNIRVSKM